MDKFTRVNKGPCACGKTVDVVTKNDDKTEYLSRHFFPKGKGFCPMSLIETV